MTKLLKHSERSLDQAALCLQNGGLVAFPTETVYGLGAHAYQERAIEAVFKVKNRPFRDPLIVHVADIETLQALTTEVPREAYKLIAEFWPGPLTFVLPKSERVLPLINAGFETVAVRMPQHPLALKLIKKVGAPLVAPSANPFQYVSPTSAQHVMDQLGGKIDMILDGGRCAVGLESTVLDMSVSPPRILRPGSIWREKISKVLGIEVAESSSHVENDTLAAPGMMENHYQPRCPVVLYDNEAPPPAHNQRVGLIVKQGTPPLGSWSMVRVLSTSGYLPEMASRLYAVLREMDRLDLDVIMAPTFGDTGLEAALSDRLRKAASKKKPQV